MNAQLAWFLQEIPSFLIPLFFVWRAPSSFFHSAQNVTCIALFLFHYFNRALIYPWRIRGGKPTPFLVFLMALVFCVWNGWNQVRQRLGDRLMYT